MRRAPLVLLAAVALAGCGGSSKPPAPKPPGPADTLRRLIRGVEQPKRLLTPASRSRVADSELGEGVEAFADRSPVRARRVGGAWAVAWTVGRHTAEGTSERMAYAVAEVLRNGRWLADIGGPVTLRPLGPEPNGAAASVPQVAVEIKAPRAIDDSVLLVDGTPIDTRGGGPSAKFISIYGAPARPLAKGEHVAVAFARAGTTASAVAWRFTVR